MLAHACLIPPKTENNDLETVNYDEKQVILKNINSKSFNINNLIMYLFQYE